MEAPNAGVVDKNGDFRQITRCNSKTSIVAQALSTWFGREFITLSDHICLQHVCRSPATALYLFEQSENFFRVYMVVQIPGHWLATGTVERNVSIRFDSKFVIKTS